MSQKHYVVWKGATPGIYTSWPEAKSQIDGRSDAQYMGFPSKGEAEQAYASTYTKALMKRSLSKGDSTGVQPTTSAASTTKKSTGAKKSSKTKNNNTKTVVHTDINIYCDGACSPNPGKSGTGLAVYEKDILTSLWYGLYEPNGTNNTAELNGMLKSFQLAQSYITQKKHVQILSDSKYSIDCITKWAKGWKTKGWTRGKGEEIKNLEIVQACYHLYEQIKKDVTVTHVKGHANIEGNELSDRMAVLARTSKESGFVGYTETLDIPTVLAMYGD
jgi:ribonuclease HI